MSKMPPHSEPQSEITPEEFQKMLYFYQMLQEQQQMLTEQEDLLNQQILGANLSKTAIEGLKNLPVDHELVIPLGSYAFTKVKIIDPSKIIVSVNKEVLIEKNLAGAIKSMEQLLKNYTNIHEKLVTQLKDIDAKIGQIKPQIDAIYQAAQEGQ
jgi:prefoldin alpha subunit